MLNGEYIIYIVPAIDLRLKGQAVIGTDRAAFVPHVAGNNCISIILYCYYLSHVSYQMIQFGILLIFFNAIKAWVDDIKMASDERALNL